MTHKNLRCESLEHRFFAIPGETLEKTDPRAARERSNGPIRDIGYDSGCDCANPSVIDGFNSGDTKSAYAAYSTGDITIVDEFAPHRWFGPHAPQDWAADYDKHAQATGVPDGIVKCGTPTRTEIEGDAAYVIVPTTYLYKEHGQPFVEEGQMTFVLYAEAGGWKIRSWTWSGVKPHPAK